MTRAAVSPSRRNVALLDGGRAGSAHGQLLSVAELQQALHELRARKSSDVETAQRRTSMSVGRPTPPRGTVPTNKDAAQVRMPDSGSLTSRVPPAHFGVAPDARWVCVIAAHAGAGASTVALAIADAAGDAGRGTNLVEVAHPTRSGLVAAAKSELGVDGSGVWRRGSRGKVTIDRRSGNDLPTGWPPLPASTDGLVFVDLGLPTPDSVARLAVSGCRVVVVCRPTVPGVRRAEQVLTAVPGPVIVASVGGGKWPGEVLASLGPRLRDRRAHNAVVDVPADRHLQVIGPTGSPLPKGVTAAGRSLLALIDALSTDEAPGTAPSMPARKGSLR